MNKKSELCITWAPVIQFTRKNSNKSDCKKTTKYTLLWHIGFTQILPMLENSVFLHVTTVKCSVWTSCRTGISTFFSTLITFMSCQCVFKFICFQTWFTLMTACTDKVSVICWKLNIEMNTNLNKSHFKQKCKIFIEFAQF